MTLLALCGSLLVQGQTSSMKSGFLNPPHEARPQVWWHWLNGNITPDGIRKDLEWMHRVGISGVHLFDAGLNTPQIVPQRVKYMTPEWNDCLRLAVGLADSLGMDIVLPSAPGWSNTGGPWVTPDDAMKRIEWRDTVINGGTLTSMALPAPYTHSGEYQNYRNKGKGVKQTPYYKDLYVIAVPVADDAVGMASMVKRITTSEGSINGRHLYDGDFTHTFAIGPRKKQAWIQVELDRPRTIRSMTIADSHLLGAWEKYPNSPTKYLEASDDGREWLRVCNVPNGATPRLTLSLPPTEARYFRLVYQPNARPATISEFTLSTESRVNHSEEKAGFGGPLRLIDYPTHIGSHATGLDSVIDLTRYMDAQGRLSWQAPEGRWRIYRFGYSLTGKTNHPASPEATGLEVDKLDSTAVRRYMEAYIDTYRRVVGDSMIGRVVNGLLIDSYEAGYATWTRHMREEFRSRRGYDLLPYLPALAGEVIGSAEASDRFLDDWRLTLGELITDNLYGQVGRIAHEQGLTTYFEAMENSRPFVGDGLAPKCKADIPMAAMWARTQTLDFTQKMFLEMQADLMESASAAHVFGRKQVAAESFTAYGPSQGDSLVYGLYPAMLKRIADLEFACGVNRIVIHESAHQPIDSMVPGLSLDIYGMWFNRLSTWAEQARGWTDYMARSSYMLQQGNNVADVAYFYGDEANATALFDKQKPAIPSSCDMDFINSDILCHHLDADGGRLVTPGGSRYRILVLGGTSDRLSLASLQAVKRLADQGATIVGRRPARAMGLKADSAEFDRIADDLWSGKRGNIIDTGSTRHAIDSLLDVPDFRCTHMDSIRYVHRTTGDAEIYWVNNRSKSDMHDWFEFRTTGRKPQIWNAVTGEISDVTYMTGSRSTYVEMDLKSADALFVVFSGEADKRLRHRATESLPLRSDTIASPWRVVFGRKMGTPDAIVMDSLKSYIDTTLAIANPAEARAVKYFSGTATYHNRFFLGAVDSTRTYRIDLGTVNYMAEVWVNGKYCGLTWFSPHSIDISAAVKSGENTLEIRVTNPWKNRICGDKLAKAGETTYTWTSYPWSKKTKNILMPAGLLGPVTITLYK